MSEGFFQITKKLCVVWYISTGGLKGGGIPQGETPLSRRFRSGAGYRLATSLVFASFIPFHLFSGGWTQGNAEQELSC